MEGCLWEFWFYVVLKNANRILGFFIPVESSREKTGRISLESYHFSFWRKKLCIDRIREPDDIGSNLFEWFGHIWRRTVVEIKLLYFLSYSPSDELIRDPTDTLEEWVFLIHEISSIVDSEIKTMGFCDRNLFL